MFVDPAVDDRFDAGCPKRGIRATDRERGRQVRPIADVRSHSPSKTNLNR
jgi:hypothetical protein